MIDGKKTYIGITAWFLGQLLGRLLPEYADVGQMLSDAGLTIAGIGAVHKFAKTQQPANNVSDS